MLEGKPRAVAACIQDDAGRKRLGCRPMLPRWWSRPGFEANWASVAPTQRAGYVDDVVAAVLFLVSPGAQRVTGQTIVVDGGWSLASPLPDAHPRAPDAGSRLR